MRFFEHESCGQCTPCRVGTAKTNVLIAGTVGCFAARGPVTGDARRFDLRSRTGGAESGGLRHQILSERDQLRTTNERHSTPRDRRIGRFRSVTSRSTAAKITGLEKRRRILEIADRYGVRDTAPLLQARHGGGRKLSFLHGRDQGRAGIGRFLLPRGQGRDAGHLRQRTCPKSHRWSSNCCSRTCPRRRKQ